MREAQHIFVHLGGLTQQQPINPCGPCLLLASLALPMTYLWVPRPLPFFGFFLVCDRIFTACPSDELFTPAL